MSGIGGYSSATPAFGVPSEPDLDAGDDGEGGATPTQAAPAAASPASAMSVWQAIQGDPTASMLAEDLGATLDQPAATQTDAVYDELASVGSEVVGLTDELDALSEQLGASGPSAIDGMTLDEIQARIGDIKAELAVLYEREDQLLAELEDPATPFLSEFWIEWDLWDTEFSIEDLEMELCELEGEVYDREFDSLWEDFWGGFAQTIDTWTSFFDNAFASDQDFQTQHEDSAERARLLEGIRERLEDADTQQRFSDKKQQSDREAVRAASVRPDLTPEVRAQLASARPLVEALISEPSREALDRLREAIANIREQACR